MGVADDFAQTLLKIQALPNAAHRLSVGKIPRLGSCAGDGRDANLEMRSIVKYERLLINSEIYPCAKRACVTIDAISDSRIGKMQIRGQEHKKLMAAPDKETGQGKVELIRGRLEKIIDNEEKLAGLAKTKYKDWEIRKPGHKDAQAWAKSTQKTQIQGA